MLLEWSAPVMAHHDRSQRWYLGGSVAVLVFAAYGIVTGNWTFTLVILLLGGTYFLTRNTPAPVRTMRIAERGFTFNDVFTQWADTKDFWLIVTPQYTELHIMRASGFDREVIIQTGPLDPQAIRDTLTPYIPERSNQKEKIVDTLIRLLKL